MICNIIMFDKYPTFQICLFFSFLSPIQPLSHWRKKIIICKQWWQNPTQKNMFLGNAEFNLCCAASRMPFFPLFLAIYKNCADEKKTAWCSYKMNYSQKYSRLRCLLHVKGLVIGFYLGWSGHTLLIRKI